MNRVARAALTIVIGVGMWIGVFFVAWALSQLIPRYGTILGIVVVVAFILWVAYQSDRAVVYRCPECGSIFHLSFWAVLMSRQATAGFRPVRCPSCRRKVRAAVLPAGILRVDPGLRSEAVREVEAARPVPWRWHIGLKDRLIPAAIVMFLLSLPLDLVDVFVVGNDPLFGLPVPVLIALWTVVLVGGGVAVVTLGQFLLEGGWRRH